ncbi:MAG: hypothetical protein ACJ786_42075 [Catenulispora sp.]
MSAQDDVLAAFGEPRRGVVPVADVEPEADGAAGGPEVGAVADAEPEDSAASDGQPLTSESVAGDAQQVAVVDAEGESAADEAQQVSADPEGEAAADEAQQVSADAEGEAAADEAHQAPADTEGDAAAAEPEQVPVGGAEDESAADEPQESPVADGESVDGVSQDANGETLTGASGQLYIDPSAFFDQLQAEVAKPKRRWPQPVLRYGLALVIAGAVAAGTAYGVAVPRRTDVPFLATPSDGRYAFPALARPVPPVGKPGPGDERNSGQVHFGDLRRYLLPAPKGAVVKEDGWEPVADFVSGVDSPSLPGRLNDAGLRRIAWRGWTMADGQHTVVELFQFPDHQAAYALEDSLTTGLPQRVGAGEAVVPIVTVPTLGDATEDAAMRKFDKVDGLPGQKERRTVFRAGDVVAIVTTTAPKGVGDAPTAQVLLLQAEMLR